MLPLKLAPGRDDSETHFTEVTEPKNETPFALVDMKHNHLDLMKESAAQAAALRRELARQGATPLGQARLEKERLEAQCSQIDRQLGAQALLDSLKIQEANPALTPSVAFNLAERRL
jgi:hypothetical protein